MKCDPSHREGYSVNTEIAKAGLGIVAYFTIFTIVACAVVYVLF